MEIKCLVLGMLRTNCYIAYEKESKKAVIIDPAAEPKKIKDVLSELDLQPEALLLTHGHFDHMLAADTLRKEYHIPVCLLKEDEELLADPAKNCSTSFYASPYGISADELMEDGQVLHYLGGALKVLATPGHTAGCCCYYAAEEGVVFTGDTLFAGSVGRCDLPTAKPAQIGVSIREKLFVLPEDTLVLPGHGEDSTIGDEKSHNPYIM